MTLSPVDVLIIVSTIACALLIALLLEYSRRKELLRKLTKWSEQEQVLSMITSDTAQIRSFETKMLLSKVERDAAKFDIKGAYKKQLINDLVTEIVKEGNIDIEEEDKGEQIEISAKLVTIHEQNSERPITEALTG